MPPFGNAVLSDYNGAMADIEIQENVSLQPYTTLGVAVRARCFAEATSVDALRALLRQSPGSQPPLVLGEGSNCLFTTDYDGLVIRMAVHGIEKLEDDGDSVLLQVGAGENWQRFLRWSLQQGYCGIENLALIPGTVGAAPIQNIGAYGVEVESVIDSVNVLEASSGAQQRIMAADCGFAYRDSLFKRQPGRFVITSVSFRLQRQCQPRLDYTGLRERLAERGIDSPTATDIADAVESIRREKLPDPGKLGNAGSFFKNPVVDAATAAELQRQHPGMPAFEVEDGVKLSAGWLIEAAGMKGYRDGDAGISPGHALVLVNHGNASGEQLWAVAARVRSAVMEKFGLELEPEPRVY